MEGRSPEFSPEEKLPTESGYSEKKQAKAIEQKAVPVARKRLDIKPITKRKPLVVSLSRKERIFLAYRKNSGVIVKLVEALFQLNGANVRQEEAVVEEIKQRRRLQEELLNALILEQKNQLTENAISQEAWDLIK